MFWCCLRGGICIWSWVFWFWGLVCVLPSLFFLFGRYLVPSDELFFLFGVLCWVLCFVLSVVLIFGLWGFWLGLLSLDILDSDFWVCLVYGWGLFDWFTLWFIVSVWFLVSCYLISLHFSLRLDIVGGGLFGFSPLYVGGVLFGLDILDSLFDQCLFTSQIFFSFTN